MDISSDVMHSSKTAKGLTVIGLKSRISILSISLTFVRNKTCEILYTVQYWICEAVCWPVPAATRILRVQPWANTGTNRSVQYGICEGVMTSSSTSSYPHPESPALGQHWNQQVSSYCELIKMIDRHSALCMRLTNFTKLSSERNKGVI